MPRRPRLCIGGYTQHIIQRGNNRSACFARDEDYIAYAHCLKEGADRYGVAVHAWVFMTNHVHLLATPKEDGASSALMQFIGRYYVRRFNYKYKRSGTLWEGRFKSSLVDSDRYVLACYRYIELNPVRAKMVAGPGQYGWSSYRTNALGLKSEIVSEHPSYIRLGECSTTRRRAYCELFRDNQLNKVDDELRYATNKGLAVGSEKFKAQIEALTGVPMALKPRGPAKE